MFKKSGLRVALIAFILLFIGVIGSRQLAQSQNFPRSQQTTTPLDMLTAIAANATIINTSTPDMSKGTAVPEIGPPAPSTAIAQPVVVDLAPKTVPDDKIALIVQHKDGRLIEYRLDSSQEAAFIHGLDPQDRILVDVSARSTVGRHAPDPNITPEQEVIPNAPPPRLKPSPIAATALPLTATLTQ